MSLAPGVRLGPYEVIAQLGVGGMGEVWRARDTNLGRQVAIKVLPDAFAQDAERLARFEREAKTLASLNHPHIAAIYGLETTDGTRALIMELVEGLTLAERLALAPLPVDEGLAIAKQIAEALEAAHEQGIIHRDLKPANIKVRADGTVKVLDFGLAKAIEPAGGSGDIANSPTITSPAMTARGVILGTAAYMAPEQARGRPADKRADIWAFGCVCYEMLTGRRAFKGEDVSDTLAAVLRADVDWALLPPELSPVLRTYLARCLKRDPKQRLADVQDIRLALEGAFDLPAPREVSPSSSRSPWRVMPAVVAAFVLGGLLVGVLYVWRQPPLVSPSVSRFKLVLPAGQEFRRSGLPVLAVAPDGRSFVYNTRQGLYLRILGELEPRLIRGTEEDLTHPFFSPDGQSVGYFAVDTGQLKRISLTGGPAVPITRIAGGLAGASWLEDDTILIALRDGIVRVAASGGTPQVIVPAADGERLRDPQFLPDGDTVLFTTNDGGDESRIATQSIRSGDRKLVLPEGDSARYLASGYLLYTVAGDLFGAPFDALNSTVTGPAMPLESQILGSNYAIANGTLVYATRPPQTRGTPVIVDRTGTVVKRLSDVPLDRPRHPSFDSTGERLALVTGPRGKSRVWFYFLDGRAPVPITPVGDGESPLWSPTSDRLALAHADGGRHFVYLIEGRGVSGPPKPLFSNPGAVSAQAWSRDGDEIVVTRWTESPAQTDVVGVRVQNPKDVRVIAGDPRQNEYYSRLSPNGRWLVHGVYAPGLTRLTLYVRPYPGPGEEVRLAVEGNLPRWSRNGRELFYLATSTGQMMVMPVDTGGSTFYPGSPTPLFSISGRYRLLAYPRSRGEPSGNHTNYDVHPNGHFALIESEAAESNEIVVALNVNEELKRLVPTP